MLPVLQKALDSYQPPKGKLYSADDVCIIQKDLNLSTHQTLALALALAFVAILTS